MPCINKMCRRYLSLAGALAFLASCSVGPDYVRPTAEVPPAFKEIQGWKVAQPQEGELKEKWWEIFEDPQLNTLEEQVAISNQNIAASEARFRQARALVQASRAGFFPTVTLGPSVRESRSSATLGTNSSFSGGKVSSDYLLPADLTWEIDIWGRIRRSVEASKADAQASVADLAAARLSAQAELAIDYFQLASIDAQKQYLNEAVGFFRKTLELTKNRYASGVAAKSDVLQADTQLKTTLAQAIDLDVQRAQLEHAIALLVGKPASLFSLPSSPLAAVPPPVPAGLPSQLLERRPDIAGAERRVAAANAQIGVAKAAYFPTVMLSASAGLETSSLAKWLTWPSRFWSVGPSVTETVFDGGLRRAHSDQARAAYDATVAAYRQSVLTGFQEVEDNLAALRILEEEGRLLDEAVEASRQTVTVAVNQYKAGVIAYLNILVLQTNELNNKRNAIAVLGRRMAASVLLVKALGGGWNASALENKQ